MGTIDLHFYIVSQTSSEKLSLSSTFCFHSIQLKGKVLPDMVGIGGGPEYSPTPLCNELWKKDYFKTNLDKQTKLDGKR